MRVAPAIELTPDQQSVLEAQAPASSEAGVRRIWRAHGLKPHLIRTSSSATILSSPSGRYCGPVFESSRACAGAEPG